MMNRSKTYGWHLKLLTPVLVVLCISAWLLKSFENEPEIRLPVLHRELQSGCIFGNTARILIDQNGSVWFQDAIVNDSKLSRALDQLADRFSRDITLQLYADKQLTFSEVWSLLETLRSQGFWKFNLVFQNQKQDEVFFAEIYAPKIIGCADCTSSPLAFEGGGLLIDLNSKTGMGENGTLIPWEHLPDRIKRLRNQDPEQTVSLIVNPEQTYAEFVNDFEILHHETLFVILLPSHHQFQNASPPRKSAAPHPADAVR